MFQRSISPILSDSFFLFGARGTGKTTFLNDFFSDKSPCLWIDLLRADDEEKFARNPDLLFEILSAEKSSSRNRWIIIDEVQKIPKLLDVVHRCIEHSLGKFALTGSSARKLKVSGANMLAGRAFINYCFPLTFIELADKFDLEETLTWGTLG